MSTEEGTHLIALAVRFATIRLEMFEVYEDGNDEFPLFVTSDPSLAGEHAEDGDRVVKRWWVREGSGVSQ